MFFLSIKCVNQSEKFLSNNYLILWVLKRMDGRDIGQHTNLFNNSKHAKISPCLFILNSAEN